MVWTHKARMHWANEDITGLILEVKIVDGTSYMRAINSDTGEVLADEKHGHPIEAMSSAKALGSKYGEEKVG